MPNSDIHYFLLYSNCVWERGESIPNISRHFTLFDDVTLQWAWGISQWILIWVLTELWHLTLILLSPYHTAMKGKIMKNHEICWVLWFFCLLYIILRILTLFWIWIKYLWNMSKVSKIKDTRKLQYHLSCICMAGLESFSSNLVTILSLDCKSDCQDIYISDMLIISQGKGGGS